MIEIKLPNGMSLSLSSDEKGEYCSMSVYNHVGIDNSGKFETEVKNKEYTNSEKDIHVKQILLFLLIMLAFLRMKLKEHRDLDSN